MNLRYFQMSAARFIKLLLRSIYSWQFPEKQLNLKRCSETTSAMSRRGAVDAANRLNFLGRRVRLRRLREGEARSGLQV